jgi:hypothetical protein
VSDFDIYKYLATPKVGRISIPIAQSDAVKRDCVIKVIKPPRLVTTFLPGHLPVEADIDMAADCLLYLDIGGPTVTLKTTIAKMTGNRTLELLNIESVSHTQKREYFRIDAQVPVDATNLPSQDVSSLEGETINISGSGALISFPSRLPANIKIKLRFTIPEPEKQAVECTAQVVRCLQTEDGSYHVAVHFYTINEEEQDKIIAFCMIQQRKHLRLRVRVLGPA